MRTRPTRVIGVAAAVVGGTIALWMFVGRLGQPAPARAAIEETLVIREGVTFSPPESNTDAAMTSDEALAAFKKVAPDYTAADDATALFGMYTAMSGPDSYRFRDQLAWGYHSESVCPPSPNPVDGEQKPAVCDDWLFLDATTGEMLEGVTLRTESLASPSPAG